MAGLILMVLYLNNPDNFVILNGFLKYIYIGTQGSA